jgi:ABC-2 type transport system permease protein
MTAITTLVVVAMIVVPARLTQANKEIVVGLAGSAAQSLGPALQVVSKAAKMNVRIVDVENNASVPSALEKGTLDIVLSVEARSAIAQVQKTLPSNLQALLQATVNGAHQRRVLNDAGMPIAVVESALRPIPLRTVPLHPPPPDQAAHSLAAITAGILLYLTMGIYGAAVASGVAQEKTSRTAEVLLAAVTPIQLLTGKVVGIGLCGLGQLTITLGAGLIANSAVKNAEIPSTVWALLPAILLWFLLGYALYSFGYAAAGAMVARQEEVQFVVAPLGVTMLSGFLLVYALARWPEAWWIRALSFLPPLAPILMPARLAFGQVSLPEMTGAALIMVAAIYGMARLTSRIYRAALLRGGARLSWPDALRLRN